MLARRGSDSTYEVKLSKLSQSSLSADSRCAGFVAFLPQNHL